MLGAQEESESQEEFVERINEELSKLDKLRADSDGDWREAFDEHGEEE